MGGMQPDIMAAGSVVAGMLALSIVSRIASGPKKGSASSEMTRAGRELVTQAVEWQRMANEQGNPVYAVHNSTLATAYLNCARLLCSDEVLQRGTGLDIHELQRTLESGQRRKISLASKACTKPITRAKAAAERAQKPASSNWL